MSKAVVDRVHWSFWLIVVAGLIFNLMGVLNFASQMSADGLKSMPQNYRVIIESRPIWATGAFAIAVFAGVLGCLLLLAKKSAAIYVFFLSLAGTIVATIHFHVIAGFYATGAIIGSLSQLLVVIFLIWYSKRAASKSWIN